MSVTHRDQENKSSNEKDAWTQLEFAPADKWLVIIALNAPVDSQNQLFHLVVTEDKSNADFC